MTPVDHPRSVSVLSPEREVVLVLHVWSDGDEDGGLRARITRTEGPELSVSICTAAGTAADVAAAVEIALRQLLARPGGGNRRQ